MEQQAREHTVGRACGEREREYSPLLAGLRSKAGGAWSGPCVLSELCFCAYVCEGWPRSDWRNVGFVIAGAAGTCSDGEGGLKGKAAASTRPMMSSQWGHVRPPA